MGIKVVKKVNKTSNFERLVAGLAKPVLYYFSELSREVYREPGSWRCLEIVYRNRPKGIIDRYFLNSKAARGARNRLEILKNELHSAVEEIARQNCCVRLISFGSGPGYEIIGCVEKLDGKFAIQATCIDWNPEALEYGRFLSNQKGVKDCIQHVHANVLDMKNAIHEHEIAVVSGLIDYFKPGTVVSILKKIHEKLVPGGIILVANMRQHNLAWTMSILGNWHIVYREPEDIKNLLEESGHINIKVWLEPEKVFCIGKGEKPYLSEPSNTFLKL